MNKCVLITGASRGIGKAIALKFAEQGYCIGINYNNSEATAKDLKNIIINNGGVAEIFPADISNPSDCLELGKSFIECFGTIDTLINNAGITHIAPINDLDFDCWNNIINTNLSSAFYLTKALLPYFINAKNGNIINISSIWGVSGASCEVAYSTSKAGLIGFTKALAKELGPSGIKVNCISPGVIDTDMNSSLTADDLWQLKESTALCRIGSPDEIANIAYFLASNDSKFITGQNIIADGGLL